MSPGDVSFDNMQTVLNNVYPKRRNLAPCTFRKGDKVRISRAKREFSKGYEQSWSDEVYDVIKTEKSMGVCYFTCKL